MVKNCPSCNTIKPVDDFFKSSHTKSGYYSYCKVCQRERDKKSREKRKQNGPNKFPTSKTCPVCKETKPISQYGIKRDSSDGRISYCKPCWVKYVMKAQRKRKL